MAYATGSATSVSALMTAIVDFAVDNCNWTLIDDISASNKVLRSRGSDGISEIIIRLQSGIKDWNCDPAHSSWQNQLYNTAHYEHINISLIQAHDPGTNTSWNEVNGKIGPWLVWNRQTLQNTGVGEYGSMFYLDFNEASFNTANIQNLGIGFFNWFQYSHIEWDGGRFFWNDQFPNTDIGGDRTPVSTNIVTGSKTKYTGVANLTGNPLFAYDASGNPCIFTINREATTNSFNKMTIKEGSAKTIVNLANTPAGAIAGTGNSMCWDGAGYIYSTAPASNSTSFYRYSISDGSWSSMTVLPSADGNNNAGGNRLSYIPLNSDIAVTMGWTSDKIFYKTQGQNSLYLYDVTGNSWTTMTTSPLAGGVGGACTWNGDSKLYMLRGGTTNNIYRYNIDANTWTDVSALPYSLGGATGIKCLQNYQNQITLDTDGTNYWLFGDEDRIVIVTEDSLNECRFQYFGNIDSFYSTQKVYTTTSGISGSSVDVTVSGLHDQFEVGQKFYIADLDGASGYAEQITITTISGNNFTLGTLTDDYAPGAIIGIDPQPSVMICNNFDAVFCLHSAIGQGSVSASNNPHKQNYLMSLMPQQLAAFGSKPNRRGMVQMWPIIIGSYPGTKEVFADGSPFTHGSFTGKPVDKIPNSIYTFMDGNNGGVPNAIEKPEIRGQLKNIFCIARENSGGTSGPVHKDEIQVGSNVYIVFKVYNMFNQETANDLMVCIYKETV